MVLQLSLHLKSYHKNLFYQINFCLLVTIAEKRAEKVEIMYVNDWTLKYISV